MTLARQYQPTAITLDIFLPDMLGWTVLNNLKLDPATRHIPVQIISLDEERQHGLSHGAFSYMVKPATTEDLDVAFDRIKDLRRTAQEAAAGGRGQRSGTGRASSSCSITMTSKSPRWTPARRRSRRCSTSLSTAACSIFACRT
ncbi:MAG: response regulator [Chthoniobacter sp.]